MAISVETRGEAQAEVPAVLLLLSAKLFSIDGKMTVTLLELSSDYAVATTTAPPPAGSIAVLSRNGIRMAARIAWVDGQRLGLRLDDPLDDARLELLGGLAPPSLSRSGEGISASADCRG